jgi:hypothetical protein
VQRAVGSDCTQHGTDQINRYVLIKVHTVLLYSFKKINKNMGRGKKELERIQVSTGKAEVVDTEKGGEMEALLDMKEER